MNRRWGCGCGGCLGSSVLVLVVLVALGYFLVLRPVQGFLAGLGSPAPTQTQSQTQPTANGAPTPSTPQAALTTADVQRFVRIRRSVRTAMGSSFTGIQTVFTDIQNGQTPNVLTVVNVLREAGGSVGQARAARQAGLEKEGMNLERYAYVRGEVNKALGVPDINFQEAAGSLSRGQLPDLNTTVRPPDTRNSALVTPFRNELSVTAPLGLLGL